MNKKKKNQKTWQSGTERKTGKIGEQALPPLPPPKTTKQQQRTPPKSPKNWKQKKKSLKALWLHKKQ